MHGMRMESLPFGVVRRSGSLVKAKGPVRMRHWPGRRIGHRHAVWSSSWTGSRGVLFFRRRGPQA